MRSFRTGSFFLSSLLLTASCKDDVSPKGYDLYAYGTRDDAATYWKNGEETPLTDGTNTTYVFDATVSGSDLYVAGMEANNKNVHVATYWKNGIATTLTDGTKQAWIYSIAVSGIDVYAAGFEMAANGNFVARYWKNGVASPLLDESTFSAATKIVVSGTDVYVTGYNSTRDSVLAMYWKNGVRVNVKPASRYTFFNDMAVSGSDVYLAGYDYVNGTATRVAKLWKNGVETRLSDGSATAEINSIALAGNDLYLAGMQEGAPVYWKNGTPVLLAHDENNLYNVVTIAVKNGDVLVAGQLLDDTGTVARGSLLWKNGVTIAPFIGTESNVKLSGAFAIDR